MPFKSKKQEKWMWANKPKMAKEWKDKYGTFKSKKNVANYHKKKGNK